jgi:hypothetical protein
MQIVESYKSALLMKYLSGRGYASRPIRAEILSTAA